MIAEFNIMFMVTFHGMSPLLKWPGGKRRLVSKIISIFPKDYSERVYHEPFLGGGAIFFTIKPNRGTINDVNSRLINFYRVVRDWPEELIKEASKYRYDKETFYKLREKFNRDNLPIIESAAIFLYLNKTGYNGLYRENTKGLFNVPFGRYNNPTIIPEREILDASSILKKVSIHNEDFSYVIDVAKRGDLVYFDPPYIPISRTSNFTSYSNEGFRYNEQIKLSELCEELDKRGVLFLLSNTVPAIEFYEKFKKLTVQVNRPINSKSTGRGPITEILVTNISL